LNAYFENLYLNWGYLFCLLRRDFWNRASSNHILGTIGKLSTRKGARLCFVAFWLMVEKILNFEVFTNWKIRNLLLLLFYYTVAMVQDILVLLNIASLWCFCLFYIRWCLIHISPSRVFWQLIGPCGSWCKFESRK